MGERHELAKLLATLEKKLTLRLTHEIAIIDVLQRVMRFLEPPLYTGSPSPTHRLPVQALTIFN